MATRIEAEPAAAPLAGRVRAAPLLNDAEAARERFNDLLRFDKKMGARLTAVLAPQSPARALIEGIADGSPFLWDIARAEPGTLAGLLERSPEASLDRIVETAGTAVRAAKDDDAVMRALRLMRREAALLVALCDIGGVWSVGEVTNALTRVADTAINSSVDYLLRAAHEARKIRLPDGEQPGKGSGYFVLGMGKLGAGELNYSSDIDLIVLYERDAPLERGLEPSSFFVRLTRDLVRFLQDRTPDGYVFRVDLRLRPDPGSTQIAVATDAALDYYERVGQTWERAAMIKARVIAGDAKAGERYLKDISPFVWRRYLDHAAIADVHDMKRQMHAFRGHEEIAVEGHNVKLGRGGIREIEFFVQTQQLIAGGRAQNLRGRETLPTLDALAEEKWITGEARDELKEAYLFLRRVEHRIQEVADEQTHTLPEEPEALERFARFFGYETRDAFAAELTKYLRRVQTHYASLFEDAPPLAAIDGKLEFPADADDRETIETLKRLGFKDALAASHFVREWLKGTHRPLRAEAAQADLAAIAPAFVVAIARTGNADAAIVAADRFFSALPGAVRLLAALRTHPALVQLLATILGTAPRLGEIVAQSPSVLDGLLDPAFFGALPGEAMLTERLDSLLKQATNDEEFLDLTRRFGREHQVLIGARLLSGTISANRAGEFYARLADILIRAVHRWVEARFQAAHGKVPGAQSAVLALGKLGGSEMTAGSDLDLLLLYDYEPERAESDGARPLHASQYYARLTQRLISALTTPTNAGKLYDVDLRLRPSGRAGPVATSLESFHLYQREEAWTWEHMALTRARVVSAAPDFRARVEREIREVLCAERDPGIVARDVAEMRGAVAEEKGEDDRWDLKYAAGGLVDLEFIAQYLQLVHAVT
ncbi:MAG TPA: bifunctional [glutamine synthetase] adenylyltransferase/[glutamine synthetase]-adenylyl-L-tyrosine phosphorylase, partial [Xanthobacteraceae bacterium]|nr:bifunctional [glutamine synthetase] adenylyltransferase/[glutamine synthetase]-adenylyl-L-tyrosine phosphorylase [Xanthobacteraceae bacterium]